MILFTVGTQLPFDRLAKIMDRLAPNLNNSVFAQLGKSSRYSPMNMQYSSNLSPEEFNRKAHEAKLIVAHAGIGSILTARKYRKPIIIFPRLSSKGEHRNDHQLATCKQMCKTPGVFAAYDEERLLSLLLNEEVYLPPPLESVSLSKANLENAIRSFLLN